MRLTRLVQPSSMVPIYNIKESSQLWKLHNGAKSQAYDISHTVTTSIVLAIINQAT